MGESVCSRLPIESWSTVGYMDWDAGMHRGAQQGGRKAQAVGGGVAWGKASVVELVGQQRVEHEVRYGLGLGVKRLSRA